MVILHFVALVDVGKQRVGRAMVIWKLGVIAGRTGRAGGVVA